MSNELAKLVNGWKQALSIIEAQQRALDWCDAEFHSLAKQGLLPQSEIKAREEHEILQRARNTGRVYLDAMRKASAL